MNIFNYLFNRQLEKTVTFVKEDCERFLSFMDSSPIQPFAGTDFSWVIRQGEYLKGKIDVLHSLSAFTADDADGYKTLIDSSIAKVSSVYYKGGNE